MWKNYKSKRLDLKCTYCDVTSQAREKCQVLHPELKPKFPKEIKGHWKNSQTLTHKANHVAASTVFKPSIEGMMNFTSNPVALFNEFAVYLQKQK